MLTLLRLSKGLVLALLFCAVGLAANAKPIPENHVRVHFHRENNDYTGWGLHLWGDGLALQRNIIWATPFEPTGVEPYGVYFDVPIRPGALGFSLIVHRGESKSYPDDLVLSLSHQGREIWLLENSGTMFTVAPKTNSDFQAGVDAERAPTESIKWMVIAGVGVASLLGFGLFLWWRRVIETRQMLSEQMAVLVEAQQRLQVDASQRGGNDELTGLPTRVVLHQALDQALGRSKREKTSLAVMFIDLDGFKFINDTHGHDAGDQVLRTTASRFAACLRSSDLVARVGGDEFVAVIENLSNVSFALKVGRKLTAAAAEPIPMGDKTHQVTASIGIAIYPDDGEDASALIKNADTAMYQAKKSGKNGYRFFGDALQQRLEERLALERGLRDALERYELMLQYRPEVNLESGRIVALEAVLRSMKRGELQPAEDLIEIAQDTDLAEALDTWAVNEACRDAVAWRSQGLGDVAVTINLGRGQIDGNNLERLVSLIEQTKAFKPGQLTFQFNGKVLCEESLPLDGLREARSKGIRLSFDVQANLNLSLQCLAATSLDVVVLDARLLLNPETRAVAAHSFHYLSALAGVDGFRVSARHVDTDNLRNEVRRLGCSSAQGNALGAAVPSTEISVMLTPGLVPSPTATAGA